jgi:hypothetical protein
LRGSFAFSSGGFLRYLLCLCFERFANGQSLDGIINAVQNLSNDAKNDEGLRNWFKELDEYVRKVYCHLLGQAFTNR